MPTDAERVQRLLAHAAGRDDPEVALLRDRAGIEPMSQYLQRWLGGRSPSLLLNGPQDRAWAYAVITGGTMPTLQAQPNAAGYELTHAVFWASNFGKDRINNLSIRAKILTEYLALSALKNKTLLDWDLQGECMLALLALGANVPNVGLFEAFYDSPQWSPGPDMSYHAYLVAALVFATRGM